ncbi:hypothetical protein [Kingella potus]
MTPMPPHDDRPSEKPLSEPVPPEDWECCGSECGDACTFAIYRREKAAYEAQLKRQEEQK